MLPFLHFSLDTCCWPLLIWPGSLQTFTWSLHLCFISTSWHQPGVTTSACGLHVSIYGLITDHHLSTRAWTNTWKHASSLPVAETTEITGNCAQPPGTRIWKTAKTSLQLRICMTTKIDISLETSVTGTAHIKQLGNIPVPRRLLSTGYQPWEGKAGRGVGARCCNSDIQPTSFWPPDEDINPPGQPSSLMDTSSSAFAASALTRHARRQQTTAQAI